MRAPSEQSVTIDYTNWRGVRSVRRITPERWDFRATEYHPAPQWILSAFDLDIQAGRSFALNDIHSWGPITTFDLTTEEGRLAATEFAKNALHPTELPK